MSGYGNKGPGWARGPAGMPPHLMGVNNDFGGGGMLQQGIPLQQQGMGLAGMAPGMPVTTQGPPVGITYPAPRGVNHASFPPGILQQQQQQPAVVMGGGGGAGGPSQRVFTGTVTKLHDSFGFVDDEVFFQTSVCKGQVPKVNDRVLVEASYNPNMPFKWNATRVQVLPNQSAGAGGPPGGGGMANRNVGGGFQPTNQLGSAFGNDGGGHGGGHGGSGHGGGGGHSGGSGHGGGGGHVGGGGVVGGVGGGRGGNNDRNTRFDGGMRNRNNDMRGGNMRGNDIDIRGGGGGGHGGNERGPDRQRQRSPPRQRQRNNEREERNRENLNTDRQERQRDWKHDNDRDKDSVPRAARKRSRSPSRRSRSPVARRSRSRSRSPPRRRARTTPRYNVSVPKVSLNFPSSNVIDLKKRYSNLYIPSDFFNAKHVWTEAYPIHDPFQLEYATSFHVFNKELVESPHSSGGSPAKWVLDPTDADYTWVAKVMLLATPNIEDFLEKTCNFIEKDSRDRDDLVHPSRVVKFLVGLKEKREMMAIGGPWSPSLDGPNPESSPTTLINTAIRTCGAMTGIDLSNCTKWTKFLKIHYRRQASSSKPARTETVVIFFPDIWSCMPTKLEYDGVCEQYSQACRLKQEGKSLASLREPDTEKDSTAATEPIPEDEEMETEEEAAEPTGDGSGEVTATHWAELDTKNMKVVELRNELDARGQPSKGIKNQLQARLQKCLKSEQETEEKNEASNEEVAAVEDTSEVKEAGEEQTTPGEESKEENSEEITIVLDDRQKEKLASAYKTPTNPCIFVHPDSKAKSGKFDCRVESLSVLLDYRTDDNKEGMFEVSLFAELFNEMLTRDSAFTLYKALANAKEKPKEKEKKEEKKEAKPEPEEVSKMEGAEPSESKPAENPEEKREASVEITEEKEKVLITKDKNLLLGCSYFDLSHCGYLESKDVEDILLTLELDLSRAELKKVANKLAVKDTINYRTLTDGEVNEEEAESEGNETKKDSLELSKGFKQFVPGPELSSEASGEDDNGMVTYKGSVIDVAKLQENLDKSEKVRSATDLRFIELQKKFTSCKDNNEKLEKARDKLTTEVKDLKKKVRGLEDELKKSQDVSNKHFSVLTDFYHKVKPIVAPPEKTEDKGTETASLVNGVKEDSIETVKEEVKPSAEQEDQS